MHKKYNQITNIYNAQIHNRCYRFCTSFNLLLLLEIGVNLIYLFERDNNNKLKNLKFKINIYLFLKKYQNQLNVTPKFFVVVYYYNIKS